MTVDLHINNRYVKTLFPKLLPNKLRKTEMFLLQFHGEFGLRSRVRIFITYCHVFKYDVYYFSD